MNEQELIQELKISIPEFKYKNGVAYELSLSAKDIVFTFNEGDELTLYSLYDIEISYQLIDSVTVLMKDRLDNESSSNKMNWYYKYM